MEKVLGPLEEIFNGKYRERLTKKSRFCFHHNGLNKVKKKRDG
jgi:hypothetical protein